MLVPGTSSFSGRRWVWPTVLATMLALAGCERTVSVQTGYRGTGMTLVYDGQAVARDGPIHQVPEPEPTDPPEPDSPTVNEIFKNVKVLNDLTALEFSRLMQAMTVWVAPDDGCEYCHNPRKLDSDEKYPKVVARRMLQMTREVNTKWKSHVADTGVTCWTCHRGQPVPTGIWFQNSGPKTPSRLIGERAGQSLPGLSVNGNSSLPIDPLSTFLLAADTIRVQGLTPLQTGNRHSIKETEWTYSLMIYMSKSLGVNCNFCHNTRALANWAQSPAPRATAWHGIRMVRTLNNEFLVPLTPVFPPNRLGPEGDGPKLACLTCHKGANRPLYGVSMLGDYPELKGAFGPRPEIGGLPYPEGTAPAAGAPAKP
jgi:photosynthetic reaction center cytochrome c subunit